MLSNEVLAGWVRQENSVDDMSSFDIKLIRRLNPKQNMINETYALNATKELSARHT
jgi:hypothetical protein